MSSIFKLAKPNPKLDFDRADWLSYKRLAEETLKTAPDIRENADSIDGAADFIEHLLRRADAGAIPRTKPKDRTTGRQLPREILMLIRQKKVLRNRYQKKKEYHLKPEINKLDREISLQFTNLKKKDK